MVELTHGGTWLKWSSLTPVDRRWALVSFITSMAAALPVGIEAGVWGFRLGFKVGSGGAEPHPTSAAQLIGADAFAYAMLASAILAVVSAYAWWRFSRNQDEMFNRIQNYAIAQAGAWTMAFAALWWLLWLGGWPPALHLTALVVIALM